jgi:hypothetical protein
VTSQVTPPTFQKVTDRLAAIGSPGLAQATSPDTEIYYDLGIYGDVLYWAHREFGTTFDHFKLKVYAPDEHWMNWRRWRRESDRRKGRYRSFKVRDLVEAIERGAWRPGDE